MQMAIFRAATSTISSGWSTTRTNNIRYADQFPGGDCGAKINAADADLGTNAGEIWVSNACGMTLASAVTINANHVLRFTQGGTYTYCKSWILNGNNVTITSEANGMVENWQDLPNGRVILEQGNGCNLMRSFVVMGANDTFRGVEINGNWGGNTGGVGIVTDTSVTTAGSRGRLLLEHMDIYNFHGDCIQVTSTAVNNQSTYDRRADLHHS